MLQALDLTFEPEVTPSVRGGASMATLAAELKRQYERLLAHDPGNRLGTHDEELHQFRVATRQACARSSVRVGSCSTPTGGNRCGRSSAGSAAS